MPDSSFTYNAVTAALRRFYDHQAEEREARPIINSRLPITDFRFPNF